MKILGKLLYVVFAATLTISFTEVGQAQQPSAPSLSPVIRTSFYPEVMCVHCIVPTWDKHYLLHLEIDKDPSLVTMYDRDGKKIVEGRVSLGAALRISVRAAGATEDGAIIAVGGATIKDGSIQHFIAEIDSTGRTVQSIRLGQFSPQQVCAENDGTVWTLGYEQGSTHSAEADTKVLSHYDFAKGLLGSYVSLDSVSAARDAILLVTSPRKSFLRCQKDGVSVLFWSDSHSVAQYVLLNTSSGEIDPWGIIAPFSEARANGFALTNDGGVFVSLIGWKDSEGIMRHGLYELQATKGNQVAALIPVSGTVSAVECQDCGNALPYGAFLELYGTEGDELIVRKSGDGWGLSWAKAATSVSSPD